MPPPRPPSTLTTEDVCGNLSDLGRKKSCLWTACACHLTSWPIDAVVNTCDEVPVCDIESVTWTDNCSDALVDCDTPGAITAQGHTSWDKPSRPWTMRELKLCAANILVEDVEGPVFEDLPNEVTYACDTTLSPPSIGELTITDNQSTVDDILADVLELDSEGNDCSAWTRLQCTPPRTVVATCRRNSYTQIREDNTTCADTPLEDLEFICLGEVPSATTKCSCSTWRIVNWPGWWTDN